MNQIENINVINMTSREIAAVTNKQHKNVMADCRAMFEALNIQSADFTADYQDDKGRTYQEYVLDHELTMTLVTGYSIELRHSVNKRWIELEMAAKPKLPGNYIEALEALIESEKQKAIMAPKAQVFDRIVERTNLLNATQVGQAVGMSAIKLNQTLTELDVYNRNIKRSKAFQQWFVDAGYGEMKQTDQGYPQALFTTAGQAWVVQKFTTEGII